MQLDDLVMLKEMHAAKRLRLSTGIGMAGVVDWNGSPEDLVSDLLVMAEKGFRYENADRLLGEAIDSLAERDTLITTIESALLEYRSATANASLSTDPDRKDA